MRFETHKELLACVVVGTVLALMAPLTVVAGGSSVTLPNGANLSVSIDDPLTCTEFIIPVGETSIDVFVDGSASVGLGEPDATFVYVMDVSGSTDVGGGTGCAPILDCEQDFVKAINQAAVVDGSVDEVGLVVYGDSAATADMSPDGGDQTIIAPDADGFVDTVADSTYSDASGGSGGVGLFTNKAVGQFTNCEAALQSALTVVNASSNGTNIVVFLSDGLCNAGGNIGDEIAALATAGAVIHSIAAGTGSDCDSDPAGNGSLRDMANGTGGQCYEEPDPGNLPDIIPALIGSTLVSLEISVDGGTATPIPNADISLPLPQPGAVSVDYTTPAAGLDPADHEICVTANGADVTEGTGDVTQCETIHLLQLDYGGPEEDTNDLNFESDHTVTVQIVGGTGPDRDVNFEVTGTNAGPMGSVLVSAPGSGDFTYAVAQVCSSLGTDTITAATVIADVEDSITFTKNWIDTVPPEVSCDPSVNPHGNHVPGAPGNGGQGQNQDGFYQLNSADPILDCAVELTVYDGSGFVFAGPFDPGDTIKYTQDDSIPQVQKTIGGPNSAVRWHLIGHGDLTVQSTDSSGNTASAVCLVPPPPK